MARTTKMRRLAGSLAVVLLAASLAACGSDGDGTGSDGDAAGKVNYVDAGDFLGSYARLQAEQQGYFEDEGIELNKLPAQYNANQLVQLVLQGQADIGLTGGTGPLAAAAAGRFVKVIATVAAPYTLQITLNNETLDELEKDGVTPDSPIEDKFAALEGLTMASPGAGSTTELVLRNSLESHGLDPSKDVTITPFADQGAINAAVMQNAANGLIAAPFASIEPESAGWGKVFIDYAKEDPENVDIPWIVLVANSEWLEKNGDVARSFIAALRKSATDAGAADPAQTDALKEAYFKETSDAAWATSIDIVLPAWAGDLAPTEEQATRLQDLYNLGAPEVKADVAFDELYDTSYLN